MRVVGQAIGSGHMREHSMVASDDAIKVIGLVYENNMDKISQERMWQLEELIRIVNSNT
ncbi:putative immunity protein [Fusibacter sp. JL298sf-3]